MKPRPTFYQHRYHRRDVDELDLPDRESPLDGPYDIIRAVLISENTWGSVGTGSDRTMITFDGGMPFDSQFAMVKRQGG